MSAHLEAAIKRIDQASADVRQPSAIEKGSLYHAVEELIAAVNHLAAAVQLLERKADHE